MACVALVGFRNPTPRPSRGCSGRAAQVAKVCQAGPRGQAGRRPKVDARGGLGVRGGNDQARQQRLKDRLPGKTRLGAWLTTRIFQERELPLVARCSKSGHFTGIDHARVDLLICINASWKGFRQGTSEPISVDIARLHGFVRLYQEPDFAALAHCGTGSLSVDFRRIDCGNDRGR